MGRGVGGSIAVVRTTIIHMRVGIVPVVVVGLIGVGAILVGVALAPSVVGTRMDRTW